MRHLIQRHRLLLQLLIFVFGMNAAVGYGACCVDMSDVERGASLAEEVAANDKLRPCHKPAVSEPSPSDTGTVTFDSVENCCAACVTAIPAFQLETASAAYEAQDYQAPFSFYVFSNIETPYRPPSRHIS